MLSRNVFIQKGLAIGCASLLGVQAFMPVALAHHGGEGSGAIGGVVGAGAGTALLHQQTLSGSTSITSFSDSMWGQLLVSMAIQRDKKMKRYFRALGVTNGATTLALFGVTGLGLAQSIYAYKQIKPETWEVTEAHHPGGHDHVHVPAESTKPAIMGIVGSSVTLGTLAFRTATGTYFHVRIKQRQKYLQRQVDNILSQITNPGWQPSVEPQLSELVGPRACQEFKTLWLKVYSDTPAS